MSKQAIQTDQAPAPIGPYSQAIKAGNFLFISGQIGLDPVSAELKNGSIQEETGQVMNNISAVLAKAGMDFNHIVKTTIFLSDMNLFADVNEVYGRFFNSGIPPARETVAVKGLPKNVNVEISVIAFEQP